jgi:hypothetical protein
MPGWWSPILSNRWRRVAVALVLFSALVLGAAFLPIYSYTSLLRSYRVDHAGDEISWLPQRSNLFVLVDNLKYNPDQPRMTLALDAAMLLGCALFGLLAIRFLVRAVARSSPSPILDRAVTSAAPGLGAASLFLASIASLVLLKLTLEVPPDAWMSPLMIPIALASIGVSLRYGFSSRPVRRGTWLGRATVTTVVGVSLGSYYGWILLTLERAARWTAIPVAVTVFGTAGALVFWRAAQARRVSEAERAC